MFSIVIAYINILYLSPAIALCHCYSLQLYNLNDCPVALLYCVPGTCIIVVATCIDGKNLILHCCKMVVVEKIEKAGGAFCWIGGGYACDWYLS